MDIITEEFTLPSLGKVYTKEINPQIKLRSMTVAEEMKRLSPAKNQYKAMADIIEDCIVGENKPKVYDLCLGDYIFLLHKLRVVTYGKMYKLNVICPHCLRENKLEIDLDSLAVNKFSDDILSDMIIYLPQSDKEVKLRFQTPRDMDYIERRVREEKEKNPNAPDQRILFTLESFINTVDGEKLDPILGREALKNLPLADMNYLAQCATKLNSKVGIDSIITDICDNCNNTINTTFRYTSEFFGPTIG